MIACGSGDGSTPLGSVGRPLRDVELRFSAEGELQVHGPNVMRGYWKDPERTSEVIIDGWYSTATSQPAMPRGMSGCPAGRRT